MHEMRYQSFPPAFVCTRAPTEPLSSAEVKAEAAFQVYVKGECPLEAVCSTAALPPQWMLVV